MVSFLVCVCKVQEAENSNDPLDLDGPCAFADGPEDIVGEVDQPAIPLLATGGLETATVVGGGLDLSVHQLFKHFFDDAKRPTGPAAFVAVFSVKFDRRYLAIGVRLKESDGNHVLTCSESLHSAPLSLRGESVDIVSDAFVQTREKTTIPSHFLLLSLSL
jgi:hypothetical protein